MKAKPAHRWRVWISGASSGIGAALARRIARRGDDLAIFARRAGRLEALCDELRERCPGGRVIWRSGDVRDRDAVRDAVREAESAFGGLDVVILNAGAGESLFPERFDGRLVEEVFAVNFLGAIWGIEAALPGFLARQSGKIVGVSSISAVRGMPTAAPYSASKAALSTFLEALRIDLRGTGVDVVTVLPGFVQTPLTDRNRFPMPFRVSAEEAARRIVRGIERGRREIAFPRRFTTAVKLLRFLPGRLYDALMGRLVRPGYRKEPPGERETEE